MNTHITVQVLDPLWKESHKHYLNPDDVVSNKFKESFSFYFSTHDKIKSIIKNTFFDFRIKYLNKNNNLIEHTTVLIDDLTIIQVEAGELINRVFISKELVSKIIRNTRKDKEYLYITIHGEREYNMQSPNLWLSSKALDKIIPYYPQCEILMTEKVNPIQFSSRISL